MTEHVDGQIVPPPLLERALTEAITAADILRGEAPEVLAEALLYAEPMQAWMHGEMARYAALVARSDSLADAEALPHEGMLREPEELVPVQCVVRIPLGSPVEAAHALGRIPLDATLKYEDKPQGLIAGIFGVGNLIATWSEER